MLKKFGFAAISLLFLFACNAVWVVPYKQLATLQGEQTARFFYPSAGGKVEAYVARPRGAGPFPLVVLLHGHSIRGKGAEPFSEIDATNLNWLRDGVINKNRNFAPVLMVSGPI
jgi:poly(3-hydroxybutyrate) depolymerase